MEGISIRHMMAHWFGWNTGHVITKYDNEGNLWVGFKCSECGCISSACMAKTFKELNIN